MMNVTTTTTALLAFQMLRQEPKIKIDFLMMNVTTTTEGLGGFSNAEVGT